MKKIGFIDYYLDCWHPQNFIKNVKRYNEERGESFEICCAYAEIDSPKSDVTTDKWCAEYGVERTHSIKEACDKSDFVVIFSPDNPEKHLPYAKEVFKYAKKVFIDKTFSAGYDDAVEIFRLAEENGVDFFSSSSLRYEENFKKYKGKATAITVYGGGGEGHYFDDYLVHHLEIVMHCFGCGARSVRYEKNADQEIVRVEFTGGRVANVIFAPCLSFGAIIADENGNSSIEPNASDMFYAQISEILDFFDGKPISFDTAETLELAKIKAAAFKSRDEKIERVML